MKKAVILTVGMLLAAVTTADVFDESVDLSKLATWKKDRYSVRYVKEASKLMDRVRLMEELDPSMKGSGMSEHLVIETRMTPTAEETYRITFSEDPSMDPHYTFYRVTPDGKEEAVGSVNGLELVVPGNGCVYTSGHSDTYFNERHKFKMKNDKLVEIMQPYLYSGLKTKTRKPVTLYSGKDYKAEVTRLPAGCPVKVLLGVNGDPPGSGQDFLIKTPAGLIGWLSFKDVPWVPKPGGGDLYDTPIEGIFWAGD